MYQTMQTFGIYSLCLIFWKIIDKMNRTILPTESNKYVCNLNGCLNSVILSSSIGYEIIHNIEYANMLYYDLAIAYFVYDLKHQKKFSVFWIHHVLTTIVILHIKTLNGIDKQHAKEIICLFEIGNIFLYIVCSFLSSSNKAYWCTTTFGRKVIIFLMYIEFIWYGFFRCVTPIYYLNKISYAHCCVLLVFQLGSIICAKDIFKNIERFESFYIVK
jgi:hypothetical protein